MSSLSDFADVVVGVDTHVDTHSAAVVDAGTGAVLEEVVVSATAAGYRELVDLVATHSPARAWAIEGTASHGAGLARHLAGLGEVVVEMDRPHRVARRGGAKTDALDAVRAAREALARPVQATPRAGGDRQALSVLLAARDSAVEAAGVAQRQLFSLIIAAPEPLRARFRGLKGPARVRRAARLRVRAGWDTETAVTATTIRALARRSTALNAEAEDFKTQIHRIAAAWRADLLAQLGVGPIVAARVLCAWSHPGRIHSDGAFAMLAGIAPIPANSGQVTSRYRLNRYGDRQLNRAVHTIVLSRQRHHEPTKAYTARRTTDGKTPREIRRCLKRYIIRDLYRLLENPNNTLAPT